MPVLLLASACGDLHPNAALTSSSNALVQTPAALPESLQPFTQNVAQNTTQNVAPSRCASLAAQSLPNTRITLAQDVAASAIAPAHCEIIGAINERISSVDQQNYAIRFHLRMPASWNGRFLFQAQGGGDGNLGNELRAELRAGPGELTPLQQGFATVTTDAGHDNTSNAVPGDGDASHFGVDPQARLDYGYNADDLVTQRAQQVVQSFYGKAPDHAYLMGCSNGGRHALVDGVRFPDYFDGIVVGDPGFNLPKAALAEAWDSQIFASLATQQDSSGRPALWTAYTPAEMALVGAAVRQQCDALDGLADNMVNNFRACKFDPAVLQCKLGNQDHCLSAAQVNGLKKVFAGAKNSKGESLYADWPWDAGIAANGWRAWKLGTGAAGMNNAINLTLGAASLPYIFNTPPARSGDSAGYMLKFNFDADAPKIFQTSGLYRVSAMEFMSATTRITPFIRRGGKMILYHGVSDPVFSINDTIQWVDTVARENGGMSKLQNSIRLFPVPGMNHCSGGPATSQFDALTAVVNWVEKGEAPDRIIATAPAPSVPPAAGNAARAAPAADLTASLIPVGRTRPLCPYPQYALYKGTGSIEDAASFVCQSVP
jgi:feruloyl esterase